MKNGLVYEYKWTREAEDESGMSFVHVPKGLSSTSVKFGIEWAGREAGIEIFEWEMRPDLKCFQVQLLVGTENYDGQETRIEFSESADVLRDRYTKSMKHGYPLCRAESAPFSKSGGAVELEIFA